MDLNIYNEDCLVTISRLQSNSIDLSIIDPPYFRILKNTKWDKFENIGSYEEWSKIYLTQLVDKLRLNGTLLLYGCSRNFNTLSKLNIILEDLGMEFVEEIIIDKGMKSIAGRINPNMQFPPPVSENIIVYRKDAKPFVKRLLKEKQIKHKKSSKEMNELLGCKSNGGGNWTKYTGNTEFPLFPTEQHWNTLCNLFDIDIEYDEICPTYNVEFGITNVWSDINFNIRGNIHPCQKPDKLNDRIVNMFSNKGDLIFIPFMGSGNEVVSCIRNNRNYIACEKDETIFEKAKNHIEQHSISNGFKNENIR